MALFLSRAQSFALFLPGFILLYCFQAPVAPLSDALTIDEGLVYGHVRTFGAAGFALACLGAAASADALGIRVIFYLYAGCFLGAALILILGGSGVRKGNGAAPAEDPEADGHAGADAAAAGVDDGHPAGRTSLRDNLRVLAGNRTYVLLILCAFFINGTEMAKNTYFSFLFLEGGGTLAGVGLAFFLMAGSEAPVMAFSHRLAGGFGQGRLLLLAMALSALRFGIFAMGPSGGVLLLLFPLQGIINGIILVEFIRFAARIIPGELHGLGITLYYAIGTNVSTIFCQTIGGVLLDHGIFGLSGARSVFLFFALYNTIGALIFFTAGLHRRRA